MKEITANYRISLDATCPWCVSSMDLTSQIEYLKKYFIDAPGPSSKVTNVNWIFACPTCGKDFKVITIEGNQL